jgi:Ca2+-binding RTX toxin-like protein
MDDYAGDSGSISSGWSLSIKTISTTDTTAPSISSFSPADGSTGVAITTNIIIGFSEPIQRGTGSIEIRAGSPTGSLLEAFNVATSDAVSISGSTLTLNPVNDLATATQYFVVLPSGAIKDLAGNAYAGTNTYDFATSSNTDSTPPVMSGIDVNGNTIILQFSEPIDQTVLPQASCFTVKVDGVVVPISTPAPVIGDASRLSFSLSSAPASSSAVTVAYTDPNPTLDDTSGVVQDSAGNDMASTIAPLNATSLFSALTVTSLAGPYLNLTLTGVDAINGTGNANANSLRGNSANNVLDGGLGIDNMNGGDGNDTYTVDNVADIVAESYDDSLGGSADTVLSSVSYALGSGTTADSNGFGIENLTLTGNAAINGTGNAKNNLLIGNTAANALNGGLGDDTLNGGAGMDTMNGGNGTDLFLVRSRHGRPG